MHFLTENILKRIIDYSGLPILQGMVDSLLPKICSYSIQLYIFALLIPIGYNVSFRVSDEKEKAYFSGLYTAHDICFSVFFLHVLNIYFSLFYYI